MSADTGPNVPPFPSSYRASGLLLHVTSLPTRYGIGDLGPAAIAWIDQLCHAGQNWWQALPLGPTGYGNSPYVPGRAEDNWSWRCTEELSSTADFHWLRDLTRTSNRLHILPNRVTEMAAHAV